MLNLFKNQKTIFSYRGHEIYNGNAIMPDGKIADWTTISFQDSVSVLPVLEDGRFIVIKQWRPAIKSWCYEQPAGGAETYLTLEENAFKECIEEIGYRPYKMQYLRDFYWTAGLMNFKISFFIGYCRQEDYIGENREEFEYIETLFLTEDEIYNLILNGEQVDSELITSIYLYNKIKETN